MFFKSIIDPETANTYWALSKNQEANLCLIWGQRHPYQDLAQPEFARTPIDQAVAQGSDPHWRPLVSVGYQSSHRRMRSLWIAKKAVVLVAHSNRGYRTMPLIESSAPGYSGCWLKHSQVVETLTLQGSDLLFCCRIVLRLNINQHNPIAWLQTRTTGGLTEITHGER